MTNRIAIFIAVFALLAIPNSRGYAQVLIQDDFDSTGLIDQQIWRLPFLGPGAFYGRTEAKTDRAIHYPQMSGGTAVLQLDTFRNNGMGQSNGLFHGAEIQTKRNFVVAGGLKIDVRFRTVDPVPGLVGGAFLFDVGRTNSSGLLVRDEIDFELLSNIPDSLLTNYWNEGPFTGPGAGGTPQFTTPGNGFDISDFQDYRLEWYPDRLEWYLNDNLIRVLANDIPDDPMNFRLNLWAPDSGFPSAFSNSLQPAANFAANQIFEMEVDSVEIEQLNTARSENLILNSSFEDPTFPFFNLSNGGNPDQAATGQWIAFNNVNFSTSTVNSGNRSLSMFGPFLGGPNASGLFQNIDVSPGEVFEASVFCRTNSGDSIQGQENFTTIKIEFLNAAGQVIPGVENTGANAKESVILEGRDPGVAENQWVQRQVNAIAPPGATRARVSLLFIQLNNGPGATFFDDFEMVRLTPMEFLLGDVNLDGVVNLLDVAPFVDLISNGGFLDQADINGDGVVNLLDVGPFVELLSG